DPFCNQFYGNIFAIHFIAAILKMMHNPPVSIDFQINNFTRLEGEIRVSRTELYVVENFD
ncbi:MAG: hypothetical protein KKH20_10740, partial [Proteobacteria bacterium]|nr:hypothetical protein [Pseudomonadota bacterium]